MFESILSPLGARLVYKKFLFLFPQFFLLIQIPPNKILRIFSNVERHSLVSGFCTTSRPKGSGARIANLKL